MKITQVDAFADRPFTGNPAAVCVLDSPLDAALMQLIALEMNLSETAFAHPEPDGGAYRLRWFTPISEVDLCGHATLATAHVLWEEGHLKPEQTARFQTRSGPLTCRRQGEWIEMDFPAMPPEEAALSPALAAVIGAPTLWSGLNDMDLLVELEDEAALHAYRPNLIELGQTPYRGLIVTARARSGSKFDFVSRFFAPSLGVPEDPVCGSAHCALAPYWSERLGKAELLAFQASPRGGVLRLRHNGGRVVLGGQAVTTLRGELVLGP